MTEITPLLKQKYDVSHCSAASNTKYDLERQEEDLTVHEAETEIPLLEIVSALFLEWQRNGANKDLTPQDIMAMHLQYKRITHGRQVFHAQHVIMDRLADAMLRWTLQVQFYIYDPHVIELRHYILNNLRENWPSIIEFDMNLARNLNVYQPPTYREGIQNTWTNCIREFVAFKNFIFQSVIIIILFGWPLSLLFMGVKYISQCPMYSFLINTMLPVGLVGIAALSWRLMLISIENYFWFSMRSMISRFRMVLKLLELIYLLGLIIPLWIYFGHSPSQDYKDHNFCDKTFYIFMLWMKYISSAFTVVWIVVNILKIVNWIRRIRYQYRPLFDNSEINLLH